MKARFPSGSSRKKSRMSHQPDVPALLLHMKQGKLPPGLLFWNSTLTGNVWDGATHMHSVLCVCTYTQKGCPNNTGIPSMHHLFFLTKQVLNSRSPICYKPDPLLKFAKLYCSAARKQQPSLHMCGRAVVMATHTFEWRSLRSVDWDFWGREVLVKDSF